MPKGVTYNQTQYDQAEAIADALVAIGSDVTAANPTKKYVISDLDDANGYYGFTDTDANWYIQKVTATTIRYVAGTANYTTGWTNRASQTYDYYYNVF